MYVACAAAAPVPQDDLLRLSEQADQLDKLDFDTAIERADACTRSRNFGCTVTTLAKAAKFASSGKDKAALAASRDRLANEREELAEENRRAEELRRRRQEERLAQQRYEQQQREREERRVQQEEARQARADAAAREARDEDDAAPTRSAWADLADHISKKGAESSAMLTKMHRDTGAALALANRIRADQAAAQERANAERAERAAEQRRDAARERSQQQQAERARVADSERAEQRRASEAAAARARAAEQAAANERERQRQAAEQFDRQERARQADAERNRAAREQADRVAAEQDEARTYLDAMLRGIRLAATKCPDGAGHFYVTGRLPAPKPKGNLCIDVHYEASCPGSRSVVSGVATNFIGLNGCFGDTYQLDPKPACAVQEVRVRVTDVRPGCK